MRRGRPPVMDSAQTEAPRKFTREYTGYTGHRSVWTYDLNKNPNGPISVEQFYPKNTNNDPVEIDETDESISKTKRKYINPKNGKLVAYTRAKELGIIS